MTRTTPSTIPAPPRIVRPRLQHPGAVVCVLVFLVSLCGSLAVAVVRGAPQPEMHDEFSYLLAADTFAHLRLANNPHPMWEHFEARDVLQQPSYASKYPPGQGLALGLGQLIFGEPVAGVWLSTALMCAAVSWMLMGYLPIRWAAVGGLLAAIQVGTISYWSQSFWGGSVAALGGALLYGALPRIMGRPWAVAGLGELAEDEAEEPADEQVEAGVALDDDEEEEVDDEATLALYEEHLRLQRIAEGGQVRHALALGLGVAMLANTRPFEGLLACVPAVAVLLVWVARRVNAGRGMAVLLNVITPIVLVLAVNFVWMAAHNAAVTGHALRLPYFEHGRQYEVTPVFLFGRPASEPVYRHRELRDFYVGHELDEYLKQRDLSGLMRKSWQKLSTQWWFYLGPALTLPLLMLPWCLREQGPRGWHLRLALVVVGLMALACVLETWLYPHYTAPMTAMLYLLVVEGLRRLWQLGRPGRIAVVLVGAVTLVCVIVGWRLVLWTESEPNHVELYRPQIVRSLPRTGRHLVLVRYTQEAQRGLDYVANGADIKGSPIVWARWMDDARNRELLEHFSDRQAWLLEVENDALLGRLRPMPRDAARRSAPTHATQARPVLTYPEQPSPEEIQPVQVQPEPMEPELVQPELIQPEPIQPEPVDPELMQPE